MLLHWLPPEDVVALCAYFNLVLIGLFTFYFCREIRLGKTASLFAAITAMLSLPAIVYIGNPLVNSMASFPLMLLAGVVAAALLGKIAKAGPVAASPGVAPCADRPKEAAQEDRAQ